MEVMGLTARDIANNIAISKGETKIYSHIYLFINEDSRDQ